MDRRTRTLTTLYDLANGTEAIVDAQKIADAMGVSLDQVQDDITYWDDRGYLIAPVTSVNAAILGERLAEVRRMKS